MAERKRETIYQEVTDRIIAELEVGRVPWVQPWGTPQAKAGLGLPKNARTERTYSGINILILLGRGHRQGLRLPELADLPAGQGTRRRRAQGRARHHRLLRRPLHPQIRA